MTRYLFRMDWSVPSLRWAIRKRQLSVIEALRCACCAYGFPNSAVG